MATPSSSLSQYSKMESAVYVSNANKSYGGNTILDNFCMNVPRSCIYGLLGASGCGKTTLLSCVLGLRKLNSGDICVLGAEPGKPGSGVPGPRVGFMPQDISLVAEFTIRDAVFFFGRIVNMEDDLIEDRFQFLKQLLDLPPDNRQLKHCSGGQQRRVSFAAAMIHKPELLILDEPTAGLDPQLRIRIWNYLVKITEEEGVAVIITTHYIEEARQAHRIGLMRGGKLLAEDSPDRLLQYFHTDNLEEVFLILCKGQDEGKLALIEELSSKQNSSLEITTNNSRNNLFISDMWKNDKQTYHVCTGTFSLNRRRLKSLFSKNIKQFIRNPGGIIFAIIFPIVKVLCFLYGIGGDPKNIPIGFVNDENGNNCGNYSKLGTATPFNATTDCILANLSCRLLDAMQDPMLDFIMYNTVDNALTDVHHGRIVGVVQVAYNFSVEFLYHINYARHTSELGEVNVWLDMSNHQIGGMIKGRIFHLFQNFQMSIFTDCGHFAQLGKIAMRLQYEYGHEDEFYVNFMVAGALQTMIFFLGAILTCTILIGDRKEGIWDRTIVAGVSAMEIVIAHFVTQMCLVFVQTTIFLVFTFGIHRIEYLGDMWLIFLFVFVQGIAGMTFGLFSSIISDSYYTGCFVITGIFIPMICISGALWPLEGQPIGLRYFSHGLPFTYASISLRAVIKKGHGLENFEVSKGMGVTLIWSVALVLISILIIKSKRS